MQICRLLFQTIFHFWNLFCYHHFNLSNAIRNLFPNSGAHLLLKKRIVYGFSIFFFPTRDPNQLQASLCFSSLPLRFNSQSFGSWQESAGVFFLLCGLLGAGCGGINCNWVSVPACAVCTTKSSCYRVPSWISGTWSLGTCLVKHLLLLLFAGAGRIWVTFLASSVKYRIPLLETVSGYILVFKMQWS